MRGWGKGRMVEEWGWRGKVMGMGIVGSGMVFGGQGYG